MSFLAECIIAGRSASKGGLGLDEDQRRRIARAARPRQYVEERRIAHKAQRFRPFRRDASGKNDCRCIIGSTALQCARTPQLMALNADGGSEC